MSTKIDYAIRQRERDARRQRQRLSQRIREPLVRRERRERRTRILDAIGYTIAVIATAFMFAWVGMNWATGCGESFVTASGERVHGECVLMPWRD